MRATAIAHPNIALVKYWGKSEFATNLPAVGSLSVTLAAMASRTTVEFQKNLAKDRLILNGAEDPAAAARMTACLDILRRQAHVHQAALVIADNDFPTGAGLASSASGFAALVTAAAAALGLGARPEDLTQVSRIGSGSAPRSLFGGFALLRLVPGGVQCEPLLEAEAWPLRVIIAVTSTQTKAVSSRVGMESSRRTSAYYTQWVSSHAEDLRTALDCVARRDFAGLAEVAEFSCLKMHAVMLSSRPALVYWSPATVACMHSIYALRRRGLPVFFTIDAGPQLKAVCAPEAAAAVAESLAQVPGVLRIIDSPLGVGARVVEHEG